MNWKVKLEFEDGTVEYLYCLSRDEARIVADKYRAQIRIALATDPSLVIGKTLLKATVIDNRTAS